MKPKLLYIFDPLCGWCYALSGELSKIESQYEGQMEFDAFTGGMILSDRTGPIAEMQHIILPGIKRIEEMSDMQFGQKYKELVQEGSYFLDSEPACVAFQIIKTLKPEHRLNAAHDILNAHFKDGKNLNKVETYLSLLDNYQISEDEFLAKFSDRDMIKQTYQEFNFVHQLGISGFPSLVLVFNGTEGHLLSQGYQSFENLKPMINKLIKEYA